MKLSERISVFARLHFIQLLWNFKGMQHLGCLSAMRPVLRRLYSGQEYIDAEKRHALFFNTHPYFAPICIGVAIKLEEEVKAGTFAKPEMIPVLKNRMSGPLAAVGDAFFWETVRPVLASLAVFAVYAFGAGSRASLASLAMILLLYIFFVERLRWEGLGWGYHHGLGVVDLLKKKDFHGSMRRIRNAGAFALGIATVLFILEQFCRGEIRCHVGTWPSKPQIFIVVTRIVALGLLLVAAMKKLSPTLQLYLLALAGFILGALGELTKLTELT